MRLTTLFGLLALAGVVTIASVYLLSTRAESFPPGTQSLPYLFTLAEAPGVDTRTDVFRLGQVAPGSASWRTLTIEAGLSSITKAEQSRKQVVVVARGDGSAWLIIEPSIVTLPADVNITLRAPFDAPLGTYRGMLYVIPYSANN